MENSKEFKTEEAFQAACVKWVNDNSFKHRKRLFCINNNAKSGREGSIGVAMGIRAGVADTGFIGTGFMAFIEFKLPKGRQSDAQKDFEKICIDNGHQYYLVWNMIDFISLWEMLISDCV
jgi:hypothetical protein